MIDSATVLKDNRRKRGESVTELVNSCQYKKIILKNEAEESIMSRHPFTIYAAVSDTAV